MFLYLLVFKVEYKLLKFFNRWFLILVFLGYIVRFFDLLGGLVFYVYILVRKKFKGMVGRN